MKRAQNPGGMLAGIVLPKPCHGLPISSRSMHRVSDTCVSFAAKAAVVLLILTNLVWSCNLQACWAIEHSQLYVHKECRPLVLRILNAVLRVYGSGYVTAETCKLVAECLSCLCLNCLDMLACRCSCSSCPCSPAILVTRELSKHFQR